MARRPNAEFQRYALLHGSIATPEDLARIDAQRRQRAAEKEQRRAEREQLRAEREQLRAARAKQREETQTLTRTLLSLPIGGRHLMTRYVLTSQVGPLMQRLRLLHGAYFTCRMEPGRGVWAERIAPPHGAPAVTANDPNADLL